jgi:SAM-dependent methyltransferase
MAILFDLELRRKRRHRNAAIAAQHAVVHALAADRVLESLDTLTYAFKRVLVIGAPPYDFAGRIAARKGTEQVIVCDDVPAMLQRTCCAAIAAGEALPFAPNVFDAAISVLHLHAANDLPGMLQQISQSLKPDGLCLVVLFGPSTLQELRDVFAEVEAAESGGISPRVAPFVDGRDGAALLQRAGFALPVVDRETLTIEYATLFRLFEDLRHSGEANTVKGRLNRFTPRGFFAAAAARYAQHYGSAEGIRATIELVTLTGWKPHANQQQPLKRGSGKLSLATALT